MPKVGLSLAVEDIEGRGTRKAVQEIVWLEQRVWMEENFRSTVASKYLPLASPAGQQGLEDRMKLQTA